MMIETCESHTIDDFSDDDPRAIDNPEWLPPDIQSGTSVSDECSALKSFYQRQCVSNSRTAVGISGISINDAANLIDEVIAGSPPRRMHDDISPIVSLRLAMDDLKAYYMESALANGAPSSQQLQNWFWFDTTLGQQIRQLRIRFMENENSKLAALGERFSVPHQWRV